MSERPTIALFHSALGVLPGIEEAESRFSEAGYEVCVIDCYNGRTFDDYSEAASFVESEMGYDGLLRIATESVASLPSGTVYAGFSNGAAQAQYCAAVRPGALGALLFSGALPLDMLGLREWPSVPVQLHYGKGDPLRDEDAVRSFGARVEVTNCPFEYYEYETDGHLFADASRADEYDPEAAAQLWPRALAFLDACFLPAGTLTF
jgi:dienelactone hydrolase